VGRGKWWWVKVRDGGRAIRHGAEGWMGPPEHEERS
jgi:hypothetical protein